MPGETYLAAGVNQAAARSAKKTIGALAEATHGPNVIGGVGFFGGMYRLQGYRRPVLVSSTDSPGTKLMLATLTGRFESVGIDVVNHCVNDVFVSGASPLFFLDYLGVGRLIPERAEALVRGVAEACSAVGCALIGGETAELPGIYPEDGFDLAGFAVGVVEEDSILDGSTIVGGRHHSWPYPPTASTPTATPWPAGCSAVDDDPSVLDRRSRRSWASTLGEALMEPHRCYYPLLVPAPARSSRAWRTSPEEACRRTFPAYCPAGLGARIDTSAWQIPPVFTLIREAGRVEADEMYRVFNMGVGMVLACSPEREGEVRRLVPEAIPAGVVVAGEGVTLN